MSTDKSVLKGDVFLPEQNLLEKFFLECKREFGIKRNSAELAQINKLPAGYTSSCWHNHACPSISAEPLKLSDGTSVCLNIWIDYFDPMMREVDSGHQFAISITCGDNFIEFHSDTWNDILAKAPLALELRKQICNASKKADDIEYSITNLSNQIHEAGFFVL